MNNMTMGFIGIHSFYPDVVVKDAAGHLMVLTFVESSATKARSITSSFGDMPVRIRRDVFSTRDSGYQNAIKRVSMGRETFYYCSVISNAVGKHILITTPEAEFSDFHQYLMEHYKLPLMEAWSPCLYNALVGGKLVRKTFGGIRFQEASRGLVLHGKPVPAEDLVVLDFSALNEELLEETVTRLFHAGRIRIHEEHSSPLVFQNLDEYINRYGKGLIQSLEESIQPLLPLKASVASFAAKNKILKKQQAACVNGIIALRKKGSRYGFMIEGMGCGKSFQAAAVADGYFNQKWLDSHPGKTLQDMYLLPKKEQPAYRNWLMAPSILLEKWKAEIEEEIPNARVTIISSFQDLVKIREKGKKRTGREWYLISKDFCKLGSLYSPIPTRTGSRNLAINQCADCEAEDMISYQMGPRNLARCKCGGRNFRTRKLQDRYWGMICPYCDNVLLKYSRGMYGSESYTTLKPEDFGERTRDNNFCYHCGNPLWGVDAKPLSEENPLFSGSMKKKAESRWYKIKHYRNFSRKGTRTAFVLKGMEGRYLSKKSCPKDGVSRVEREYGPRKTAPSMYIRKYMKGFFDFNILDEVHKYESGGSAQANAAYALSKVSSFTLGLTGTISNGKADSFFHLLFMLDPEKMNRMGYQYNSVMQFSYKYGSVETVYMNKGTEVYNSSSRGVMKTGPSIKPGISPFLLTDFLLEKSVFLDLSDMSDELPQLEEYVEIVEQVPAVLESGRTVHDLLSSYSRQEGGKTILSQMLFFDLSYPDKPYGRRPIMSPVVDDLVVANPQNYEEYENGRLLPKEERLVEIVKKEQEEGRNCFIYASFSADAESSVLYRLKEVLEKHCYLKGKVFVLEAGAVEAKKREAFIHQKAAEGYRVFICNPKIVETGLDFCFRHEGRFYNFPTIIFYQLTYELAVMWQASRRAYRLIQPENCRIYWMAYDKTAQTAALQIMGEKQVATAAIQGRFSADGLAAMAKGVDPRVRLAQMLSDGDMGDASSIQSMFGKQEACVEDVVYQGTTGITFFELMKGTGYLDTEAEVVADVEAEVVADVEAVDVTPVLVEAQSAKTQTKKTAVESGFQMSFFQLFGMGSGLWDELPASSGTETGRPDPFLKECRAGVEPVQESRGMKASSGKTASGKGTTGKKRQKKERMYEELSLFG